MANRSLKLIRSRQTYTDAHGREVVVATIVDRSKRYPAHGAKRAAKPVKSDAAPTETGV